MSSTRRTFLFIPTLLLISLALVSCESYEAKVKIPPRILYMEAEALENEGLLSESQEKFKEITEQNPGTLLGSFAYIRMAEILFKKGEWEDAEVNYRLFLTTNQKSHLTSFVIYRLIAVQHNRSFTGLIFPSRDIERNMEPNRRIIREYQRFFFLYPKSIFLPEVKGYYLSARESLAAHEQMVGDFYFERDQFNAAASRYLYLLRTFPQYPDSLTVLSRLIESYQKNRQPELANEMQRLYQSLSGQQDGKTSLNGPPAPSASTASAP